MAKLVAFLSTACLILLLIATIIYLRVFAPGRAYGVLDQQAVVKEVKEMKELVTVRYSIEKVIGLKEQKPLMGNESILLLVQGKVLAGVDLNRMSLGDVVLRDRRHIVIRLTPPHITEAFLDEKYTKVWDRSITWWTPWVSPDLDLEHKARMKAIEDIKAAALEMGILGEARKNAEGAIRLVLKAFGAEEAVFDYSS